MPWSDHSQNLAPSTIQGPASLNKESLLCGLASSRLISSQRTSAREASTADLATTCNHVVSDVGPEQGRARADDEPGPARLTLDDRNGVPPGPVHGRLSEVIV